MGSPFFRPTAGKDFVVQQTKGFDRCSRRFHGGGARAAGRVACGAEMVFMAQAWAVSCQISSLHLLHGFVVVHFPSLFFSRDT